MLDHRPKAVEVEHCSDGKGSSAGSSPQEWVLAVELEGDGLPARGQVDAAAHHVLPPPAAKSLVTEAGNDSVVRHEPRLSGWSTRADRPVCREGKGSLDQDALAGVEHYADMKWACGGFPA